MSTPTRYNIFLSAVSGELGSYRARLAAALRRKGLRVCEQQDFRQGGDTLIRQLNDYIQQCDAVILLVGEWSGGLPTAAHAATLGDVAQAQYADYHQHSGETAVSYTQWEYLLARHHGRPTYVYVTKEGFEPDAPNPEDDDNRRRQQAYRAWIRHHGKHTEPLTSWAKLVEDVLVQNFPDIPLTRPVNLPTSLGEFFQGREETLEELRQQLTAPAAGVQTSVIVGKALHGLGGVGKTSLAVEYGWRYREEYSALLLLTGNTAADLDRNLAALADTLALGLDKQLPQEETRQAVLRWLRNNPGWLLILDNLDTTDAQQAALKLLKTELSGARGHLLMTSRLSNWPPLLHPQELDVLTAAAATQLLLSLTEGQRRPAPDDEPVAQEIAQELGRLPLALEQAAAYIATNHSTLRDYQEEWRANYAELLDWYDDVTIEAHRRVAATWKTSFDKLRQDSPDAQFLLNRLAWLAPDPIPETLLDVPVPDAAPYTIAPRKVLTQLTRYSLAKRDLDSETFTVHRLVQAVTRQRLDEAAAQVHLVEALKWMNKAFDNDAQDVLSWPTLNPLVPHALAVTTAEYVGPYGNPQPTSRILNNVGQLLDAKAQLLDAEPLMRRALAIDEASFGPYHPHVAVRLSNLAQLLQDTNRLAEAEPLMRRALFIGEASFGPHHPHVAVRLNNLAVLLQITNRLVEAEPLMRRALTIDEVSFGPQHPRVAIRLNNLAQLFKETDRLSKAESLMRRALVIDENSFGLNHPNVARDLSNLAQLLKDTNRLAEAEPLMHRALAIYETSLGLDHPHVARISNNLAQLFKDTNRLVEAESLIRRALAIDEVSFGPQHPRVAIRLSNLTGLLVATDRLAEAEPLMRKAFLIFLLGLGLEHPDTKTAAANYYSLLLDMGQSKEQAIAQIQVLLHDNDHQLKNT